MLAVVCVMPQYGLTVGPVRRGPGAVVSGQISLELEKTGIAAVLCINLGQNAIRWFISM